MSYCNLSKSLYFNTKNDKIIKYSLVLNEDLKITLQNNLAFEIWKSYYIKENTDEDYLRSFGIESYNFLNLMKINGFTIAA